MASTNSTATVTPLPLRPHTSQHFRHPRFPVHHHHSPSAWYPWRDGRPDLQRYIPSGTN